METRERLIELIKNQIEIERENVKQVYDTEKKVDNAAAKLSLLEIRLDSQKHAGILSGILEVLNEVQSSETLWEHRISSYIDPFVVKRELQNHEEREVKMIKHVEEEIKQTKDEGLKLLLQHVLDDERKHHEMLKTIVNHLHEVNP
jgi:rubrerythrin